MRRGLGGRGTLSGDFSVLTDIDRFAGAICELSSERSFVDSPVSFEFPRNFFLTSKVDVLGKSGFVGYTRQRDTDASGR